MKSLIQDDFTIKPYCKLTSNGILLDIDLVDSQGNDLECNWIMVSQNGDANSGKENRYYIEVSSYGAAGNAEIFDPATPVSFPGLGSMLRRSNNLGIVELFLPDTARTSKIRIVSTQDKPFIVNYGVAVPYNPMRFKDRPTGS